MAGRGEACALLLEGVAGEMSAGRTGMGERTYSLGEEESMELRDRGE